MQHPMGEFTKNSTNNYFSPSLDNLTKMYKGDTFTTPLPQTLDDDFTIREDLLTPEDQQTGQYFKGPAIGFLALH